MEANSGDIEFEVTWKDGSVHPWHCREPDLEFRQKHGIPTNASWDLQSRTEKGKVVSGLLHWADRVGVPSNSQIREILGGLVRILTQEWMEHTASTWKMLTQGPLRSANESSASAQTDDPGAKNETENMRFS